MNITKKSDKIKASVVEKIRKGYSFMGEKKKHSNMTTLMGADLHGPGTEALRKQRDKSGGPFGDHKILHEEKT